MIFQRFLYIIIENWGCLLFHEKFWGGFMKKRISCNVIESKLLCDDLVSLKSISPFNFQNSHLILNNNDSVTGAAIYTKKLNITKVQTDSLLTDESLDFYA